MAKLTDKLKAAISKMSASEKDKILFRLVAKDEALVRKLEYQLLEKGKTSTKRRQEIHAAIVTALNEYKKYYYSPGYLLLQLRSISGAINEHVKVTKDKEGEVELNFLMLNESLKLFGEKVKQVPYAKSRTFNNYVVQRALKMLKILYKMDKDTQFRFRGPMRQLGKHISQQPLMVKLAPAHGLDVEWLIDGELPERFKIKK